MKNIFRFLMAVAILFTASCTKEDVSSSIGGGEVELTFTANLADMGTRLYGDGSKANVVYVGVYEAGQKTPLQLVDYTEGYPVTNGKATITVVLLKDKVYDLVFWAQNKAQTCYGRNWPDRSITVNYDGAVSQDETRDAFFLVKNGFKAGHDETVFELRRPFAQLRAGISEADYAYVEANGSAGIATSQAVIKGVANVLSLNDETAEVYGDVTATFGVAAVAAGDDEKFTVNGADYYQLSMNYLLVREKTLVDVTYTFADDNTAYTRPYYNVPVQRNYRTNIIGQLISSPMDFTVIIKPEFEGEHTVDVWDGKSVAKPAYDSTTQTYTIVKPSELAWIAKTVNAGVTRVTVNDNMRGKTIKLTSDIDLGGHEWLPIGYITGPAKGDYEGYPIAFKGTFDGDGHTVKGLYVRENRVAGLFGCLCGATIKNVNIVGAELISNHYAGAIAAWNESRNTVIENCHVDNAVITLSAEPVADGWDNGDKAGSIIGFLHGGKVDGCSVKNVTVTAYRDFGGIVGYAQSNATISNNSVLENVKLIVDNAHNYKNYTKASEYSVNSIVGDPVSVTLEGNTGVAEMILPADSTDALDAAIKNANGQPVTIVLKEGTYTMPSVSNGDVTIIGNGDVVLDQTGKKPAFHNTNLNFENVTIKYATNGTYVGFQHLPSANYKNCVIEGQVFLYGENEVFEKCTFVTTDAANYNVWTYGAKNVVFNECTFNCAGKSILVYKEVLDNIVRTVTLNNCTINASAPVNGKAAVEVDSSSPNLPSDTGSYVVNINNTTANGFANGNVSGNSLWNNKLGDKLTVYVDGACVLAPTPKADANGNYAVQTAAGLQNAIASAASGATITLAEGTYEGHFDLTGKNITLLSTEGAVIKGSLWIDTCAPVIKGLTLTNPNGVQHPNPTNSQYYKTVNNQYPLVGAYNNANVRFENCVFDIVGPTVYGFYGYAHNSPVFEACTFNCNGIRPIANNGDALTINGCTFNDQYHYSARIFENSGELQTVVYTNNTVQGTNAKGEFEGINISKKGETAVVLGNFTIKGNTNTLKYRHHMAVTMDSNCTYDSDIANFAFEKEN